MEEKEKLNHKSCEWCGRVYIVSKFCKREPYLCPRCEAEMRKYSKKIKNEKTERGREDGNTHRINASTGCTG